MPAVSAFLQKHKTVFCFYEVLHMSIRNSMCRLFFALVVPPFLLFMLLVAYLFSNKMEKVITDSLQVVANAQVAEMTDFCEQQRDYLTIMGNMNMSRAAMRGQLNDEMQGYLDNMLEARVQTMGYLDAIAIIDKDRRVAACGEQHDVFANDGIDPLIEMMGDKTFYISDTMLDEEGNKTLVAIAKIEDGEEVLGYVLAELCIDFYKTIRERAELWNESTFYLLDGKGKIISAGTSDENRDSFVTTEAERKNYTAKYGSIDFTLHPQGSFRYKVGGTDYITYYSNLEYTNWRVMLSVNLSAYQSQKTVYYMMICFILLLWFMLAAGIGWFASHRIIHPIKNISDTLNSIRERQDYSPRVEVGKKDELGALAAEVNGLLEFIETENLYKMQQQRLLQERAGRDALTKVFNRERISQSIREAVERHRNAHTGLAVLFVDIDDFKDFNNNYGHNVGDQALMFLASVLERETNGTVGRVGGDEFVILIESPGDRAEMEERLVEVEKTAAERFVLRGSGVHLPVYCCIGAVTVDFSVYDAVELTCEKLMDMADHAMYQMKNGGKHGHVILEYSEKAGSREV